MRRRLDSPLVAAFIVMAGYGWFLLALLGARHGDVSRFVLAGGPGVDRAKVPAGLTVTESPGYDGLAFYRLALTPFTSEQTAFGITLDNPAYRQQRIVYPLIVWALTLGQSRWVPWMLVLVNWLALAAMAAAGAGIARQFGRHALWGVLLPAYPGFLLSFSRDTSEIVAAAFVAGGIAALGARRTHLAALSFALAVVTRETTLLIVAALALVWLWKRRVPLLVWLVPVIVYASWQLFVWTRWNVWAFSAASPEMTVPFVEWWKFVVAHGPRPHWRRLYFYEAVHLGLIVLTTALLLRRTKALLEWKLAWVACLALAACLPELFWFEDFGFLRVCWDVFVLAIVVILGGETWARWFSLATTFFVWQFLAQHLIKVG